MGHASHDPDAYGPLTEDERYLAQLAAEDEGAEAEILYWSQLAAEDADAARAADGPPSAVEHDVL